jgi:putative addiction module killer protein
VAVYQLRQTETFAEWLTELQDNKAKARILARLESARLGNLGDCKAVGSGIREMRIHTGPGYRVYLIQKRELILILLCGGSKSSQRRDVARARRIANEIEDDGHG